MTTNNGKKGFVLDETITKLLLVVGGLLLVFLSYQFGFRTFQSKTADVSAQMVPLAEEVSSLLVIQQDVDNYTLRTSTMKKEIDNMLQEIEVQVPPQDRVMFAVMLESDDKVEVKRVEAGDDVLVYSMNAAGNNPDDAGKALYCATTTLETHTTYVGLKEALQKLLDNNDKVSIAEADFSTDEQYGGIVGNVNISMFYLVGSDRAYTPYDIKGVPLGTEKVFGESAEQMVIISPDEPGTAGAGNSGTDAADEDASVDTDEAENTDEE
ncbi:MAG: hypothetical protein ACI4DO_04965 [Roseburia sp.]